MSHRGISDVVLSYSHLDGGAARAREGIVSLFSDFTRGRPIAFLQDIYKACSLYIVCNIIRSSSVDSTYIFMSLLILSLLNTFSPLVGYLVVPGGSGKFLVRPEGPVSEVSGSSRRVREVSSEAGGSSAGGLW